jgi:hypothetical protein
MRSFHRSSAAALAVGAAVLAAAGCASAAATAPASTPATVPAGLTSTSSPSAGTPEQQAEANAAVLLKAFTPPAGARREASSPVPSSPVSSGPQGGSPEDADVVTRTAWWLAPGTPLQLLAWEAARTGGGYHRYGTGMNGPGVYNESFAVPAVPGLFDERDLTVSAVAAGHGQSAIRVDALVDWIPLRAPGDTVPAGARVAVLTETRDAAGKGKAPVVATKTVTTGREVAALAAYLNHLPVNVPGQSFNCPGFGNGNLTVSFRARPGGPALAQASASLSGCGFLAYTMPGHPPAGLGEAEAGDGLLTEVNHVTGLHWKLPAG